MSRRDDIAQIAPDALFADGWDDEIMGTAFSPGRNTLVVYDGDAIVEHMVRDGSTRGEAEEYFSHNIDGAWAGALTPIFLRRWCDD